MSKIYPPNLILGCRIQIWIQIFSIGLRFFTRGIWNFWFTTHNSRRLNTISAKMLIKFILFWQYIKRSSALFECKKFDTILANSSKIIRNFWWKNDQNFDAQIFALVTDIWLCFWICCICSVLLGPITHFGHS